MAETLLVLSHILLLCAELALIYFLVFLCESSHLDKIIKTISEKLWICIILCISDIKISKSKLLETYGVLYIKTNLTQDILGHCFEWVSDCCLMPTQQFFSYMFVCHGENKLSSNEMMMKSALYERPTHLVGFLIVLAHWNNSPRIDMSPQADTLSWFRSNQS
jgi:hypothetical protein